VKAVGIPFVLAGLLMQWWNVNSCGSLQALSLSSAVLVVIGLGLAWYLPLRKDLA